MLDEKCKRSEGKSGGSVSLVVIVVVIFIGKNIIYLFTCLSFNIRAK